MRFSGVKSIKSGLELCEVPRVQRIYLNYTTKGTHTGDIEGSPETGKEIEFGSIMIARVENGKFVEEWDEMDTLGMMMQLGMELKPIEEK